MDEQRKAAVLNDYRDKLADGRTLLLCATSARGEIGYRPPINRRDWAYAMGTVARMAQESDALAAVASAIIGKCNLYGTGGQCASSLYEAAYHAMADPYVDVIGLAGPEPGRRSDRTRVYTLGERILVQAYLNVATQPFSSSAPGHGWALADVASEARIRLPEFGEVRIGR